MDPWAVCQGDVTISECKLIQNFEDNFSPTLRETLPDSDKYLASLEAKLQKLKSDPDLLKQLAEKREHCMQQLLQGSTQNIDQDLELEEPVNNPPLLRAFLPHKQGLNQGEIVELVKYDQLGSEDSDSGNCCSKNEDENRSP